ncbi:hypothetical protein [Priestia aryabhattai]
MLKELLKEFNEECNKVEEENNFVLDQLRMIEEIKLQLRESIKSSPDWTKEVIEPIASLISKKLDAQSFTINRVGDMRESVKVSFIGEKSNLDSKRVYELVLVPEKLEDNIIHYKTGKTVERYDVNTIGAIGGLNDEIMPLPSTDNMDDILYIVKSM